MHKSPDTYFSFLAFPLYSACLEEATKRRPCALFDIWFSKSISELGVLNHRLTYACMPLLMNSSLYPRYMTMYHWYLSDEEIA
jgi:hypothetical protein